MTRIAIASTSKLDDPAAFSGTPFGLARGLEANGVAVVGLNSQPPDGVQTLVAAAGVARRLRVKSLAPSELRHGVHVARTRLSADRALRRVRTLQVATSFRRAGSVDGCVQWGTDFSLPGGLPYVTYDDQTVIQAGRAFPYSWITNLSIQEWAWLVEQQRRVFEGAIACCTTTEWAARSVCDDFGIDPRRVRVVGIGPGHDGLLETGRDWTNPRFLFVGHDWERKNGPLLLRAFERVRAAHPTARLDLVGGHPDLLEPGVSAHGRLDGADHGAMTALSHLFATATCFVLPSQHEPSALSYVEASSAGIGSVGTTSGGAQTLLANGGILVDPTDLDGLTAAMERFCDPFYAMQMGENARKRAELLTWERTAQRLLAAINGLPDARDLA